jgi:putative nucleotidyltransferase with HDIG domain
LSLYLVGGYLRDQLLGRATTIKDFDYAVAGGSAYQFAEAYASAHAKSHFVPLDVDFDSARVVTDEGIVLDFAGCVGGDIKLDIFRRDFSINALYWDPKSPERITDLAGGMQDIDKKSIRALSENVLKDDPLRCLRAFRFAAMLDFDIETHTYTWIKKHHKLLEGVAPERINHELFIVFASRSSEKIIKQLAESGILEVVFPELAGTRVVPKNAYHHLDLFEHSIETVVQTEKELALKPEWLATDLNEEISFGVTRLAATKVASLLHDIGKPATWHVTPDGKHTFIGHDRLGADMVAKLAERMHWSRPVERFVEKLVKWHLRPGQLFHQTPVPSDKAVMRFYRNAGSDVPELILLALGDLGATQGPSMTGGKNNELRQKLIELLSGFNVFINENRQNPKLLNGTDVMKILGIEAGPEVGELLNAVEEAQEFKEVTNRAQAEQLVRKLYRGEP